MNQWQSETQRLFSRSKTLSHTATLRMLNSLLPKRSSSFLSTLPHPHLASSERNYCIFLLNCNVDLSVVKPENMNAQCQCHTANYLCYAIEFTDSIFCLDRVILLTNMLHLCIFSPQRFFVLDNGILKYSKSPIDVSNPDYDPQAEAVHSA